MTFRTITSYPRRWGQLKQPKGYCKLTENERVSKNIKYNKDMIIELKKSLF